MFEEVKQYVNESYEKCASGASVAHFERAVHWVKELKPDATLVRTSNGCLSLSGLKCIPHYMYFDLSFKEFCKRMITFHSCCYHYFLNAFQDDFIVPCQFYLPVVQYLRYPGVGMNLNVFALQLFQRESFFNGFHSPGHLIKHFL